MKKTLIILVVTAVFVSEMVLLYKIFDLNHIIALKNNMIDNLSIKYSAMQQQYPLGILNCGQYAKDRTLVDTLDNKITLLDFINTHGEKIIICRFAELECQECIKYAISVINKHKDVFDMTRVLFLANTKSKRIFKLQNKEYNIQKYNVLNCVEDLGIQAEQIEYPYFIVIDNELRVCGIYFPNKSTHGTDFDFKNVKLMYENLVK
ncbi:MAG: hypothetical protein K5685_00120 [Bacteroidales bacterium]|nr:hypothetical protein [Bacteroidales bacterium]